MKQLKNYNVKKTDWSLVIWLFCLFILMFIGTVLTTAAVVKHSINGGQKLSQSQHMFIAKIADFPSQIKALTLEIIVEITDYPIFLLIKKTDVTRTNHVRHFPEPSDPGYLLLPALDALTKSVTVKLIRIADGKVIWEWVPNWSSILAQISDEISVAPKGHINRYKAYHPIILQNGDLIFNTFNSLVRLKKCGGNPQWTLTNSYHHSNELSADQKSVWVNSTATDYFSFHPWIKNNLSDDSIANVTLNGTLLSNNSFSEILISNGLAALMLGTSGLQFNKDPIHLNQIVEAAQDSRHWKRGDLLISARNLSTLFIYRPSTKKIVWHKQGPWMNQHSVAFLDTSKIYVLNNNVYSANPSSKPFLNDDEINGVMVYDFDDDTITEPFKQSLADIRPKTVTEGRAQILWDGGLFFEETNNGRIFRINKDGKLLWSFIKDYNEENIAAISWSRYYNPTEISMFLSNFNKECSRYD